MEDHVKELVRLSAETPSKLNGAIQHLIEIKNQIRVLDDSLDLEVLISKKEGLVKQISRLQDEVNILVSEGITTAAAIPKTVSVPFSPLCGTWIEGSSKISSLQPISSPTAAPELQSLTFSYQETVANLREVLKKSCHSNLSALRAGLRTDSQLLEFDDKGKIKVLCKKGICDMVVEEDKILVGAVDGIHVCDLTNNEEIERWVVPEHVSRVQFVNHEGMLYGTHKGKLEMLKTSCTNPILITKHKAYISGIRVHPSQEYVVTSSIDGTWAVSCVEQQKQIITSQVPCESINCIDLCPFGSSLAMNSATGIVLLWDIQNSTLQGSFKIVGVRTINFLKDGRQILTASGNALRLFDVRKVVGNGRAEPVSILELDEEFKCLGLDESSTYAVCGFPSGVMLYKTNFLGTDGNYKYDLTKVSRSRFGGGFSNIIYTNKGNDIYASDSTSITHFKYQP